MTEVREEAQLMADNVSKEREGGEKKEMSADPASPRIHTEARDTHSNIKHTPLTCHDDHSPCHPSLRQEPRRNKPSSYMWGEVPNRGDGQQREEKKAKLWLWDCQLFC